MTAVAEPSKGEGEASVVSSYYLDPSARLIYFGSVFLIALLGSHQAAICCQIMFMAIKEEGFCVCVVLSGPVTAIHKVFNFHLLRLQVGHFTF